MDTGNRADLSALMDGELAAEPTRFLLRRLDHDPELAATWSRWHLIRACLASDASQAPVALAGDGFAARVAAAIAADEAHEPPRRTLRWARYVGGGALAAGVAVAALMLNAPNPRVATPSAVAQRPAAVPVVATALAQSAPAPDATPPPWLLARQPTALSAQPASADVVYGTGLMQPDYLRRATFARDATAPYAAVPDAPPYSIVWVPEAPPPSTSAAAH